MPPIIELRGITKAFPGAVANDDVDFDIYGGQVYAILGENGAGKSTLTKIIYGFYQADSGSIAIDGRETQIRSSSDSRRLGIGMVFQDFSLAPALTVGENIALFLPKRTMTLHQGELGRLVREVSSRYGLPVDPDLRVDQLSLGERQRVELVKLLLADARVLIFDEPTSVLSPQEAENLFRVFGELKDEGYAVVFITHKVREVLAVADVIMVMRRGAVVDVRQRRDVDQAELVAMMFGEVTPPPAESRPPPVSRDLALEFEDVATTSGTASRGLRGVSFQAFTGEILGIAGIAGNGQSELGEALLGLQPATGSIRLFGDKISGWTTDEVLCAGVRYLPEDAIGMAMVPDMSVTENLLLGPARLSDGVWLDLRSADARLDVELADFPLDLAPRHTRLAELSGGNVQRVLLARELSSDARVLVACYPTRGLDVISAESARRLLSRHRDNGAAIVLVSEDLDELIALSDRILVMREGTVVGEFQPRRDSLEEIGLSMTGH